MAAKDNGPSLIGFTEKSFKFPALDLIYTLSVFSNSGILGCFTLQSGSYHFPMSFALFDITKMGYHDPLGLNTWGSTCIWVEVCFAQTGTFYYFGSPETISFEIA